MAGSIRQRGKHSWELSISLGQGADGKYIRKYRNVKAKNKTEARKLLTAFENEINSGEYIEPSKLKFDSFVDDWRKLHASKHFASETMENYNYILNAHILPALAHKKLDEIQPIHISQYLDTMEKENGFASSTIYRHYAILRSIFSYATDELNILKSNPVASVKKPKVKNKQMDVYTDQEVDQLFSLLDKELSHYALMVKLAIMGGFRRGEILGLLWKNINFQDSTIFVEYSLSHTKDNGYEMKPPKNGETRTVSMPHFIMQDLKEYHHKHKKDKLQSAELWDKQYKDFVFSTSEANSKGDTVFGKPFYPGSVSRWWNRFLNRTGFKKISFHSLRHTASTLLINQGEHPKNISARLGHKDIQITMNLYGHHLQEASKNAADKLEKRYGKDNA